MHHYIIGIDTGGTFTDGVLLDTSSGEILQTAKVATTHHNLSKGIARVLKRLLEQASLSGKTIEGVAISSTLATNAVVEGRGARVAVLVIGYVKHFRLPVKAVLFIKGGHTITGAEDEPLDLEYLISLLPKLSDEVDAYGVCAAMSFKNPSHELVVEKAIQMIDRKPVFCSHRISDMAGMEERAATAGLHAKLMPLMDDFTANVEKALLQESVGGSISIVSGNGKLIEAREAVEHAGMTVASGPACTALFGAYHSDGDAVILDVGGTTTDITMIKDGRPLLSKEGCHIGRWRTHVEAIDMYTHGIGGDSLVLINRNNALTIGPQRVIPIATCGSHIEVQRWLGKEEKAKCIELLENVSGDSENNRIVSILREKGPCTLARLQKETKLSPIPLEKELEKLSRSQLIRETGFTPTDALHALGRLDFGEQDKCCQAAEILGSYLHMSADDFAALVVTKTVATIEQILLDYLTSHFWKSALSTIVTERSGHPVLGVEFSLNIPLIGIGAASRFFLPQVAERLKTTVSFPPYYQVGNAMGAALILGQQKNS